MTPGGIRGEFNDCRTCWDSLKEKKAFLKLEQGLALLPMLLRSNPNPDYLLPFFTLILLSSVKNQRHSSRIGGECPQPGASKLKKG